MQKKILHTSQIHSYEILIDEKDFAEIFEAYTTQIMLQDDDKRKSKESISSSQKMIAMSEQWVCEHHRDERTTLHQIENSDQTYWYLMMLIQSIQQIQKRKLIRTLNSYWMKSCDERPMQRRWYSFETLSMKIDLFRDSENTSRTIRIEQSSEYRYMIQNIILYGINL